MNLGNMVTMLRENFASPREQLRTSNGFEQVRNRSPYANCNNANVLGAIY